MCGRFTLKTPVNHWITNLFPQFAEHVTEMTANISQTASRYNIAPTQEILVMPQCISGSVPKMETMRWGLVPAWADSLTSGYTLINARSESLAEKPTYKQALSQRRCIILADGYYEWQSPPAGSPKNTKKLPFWIHGYNDEPLAFAGLWAENNKIVRDQTVRSVTIITTASNEDTQSVHDRMPAMLRSAEARQLWLDLEWDNRDELLELLRPAPTGTLKLHEVSTQVNVARNDTATMIEPID